LRVEKVQQFGIGEIEVARRNISQDIGRAMNVGEARNVAVPALKQGRFP